MRSTPAGTPHRLTRARLRAPRRGRDLPQLPSGGAPRLFPAADPCQRLRLFSRRLHLQRENPCALRGDPKNCCPNRCSSWRSSDGNPALSLRPPKAVLCPPPEAQASHGREAEGVLVTSSSGRASSRRSPVRPLWSHPHRNVTATRPSHRSKGAGRLTYARELAHALRRLPSARGAWQGRSQNVLGRALKSL